MKNLKKQYSKKKYPKLDFNNLNEKDIIYFCRDSLSSLRNDVVLKEKLEAEILEIIKSKEWDWSIQDIDKNTILTYPIYNGAYSIVKYLLENKKYDLSTYSETTANSLKSSILIVHHDMVKNILGYNINPLYVHEMVNKAYLNASFMSKKEDCYTYLQLAELLIDKNISLNNTNHSLLNDSISHIILNNNENRYPYLPVALHHLVDKYPLSDKEKVFHVKKFFNPAIWKNKKLPKDISQTLENWLDYHTLQKDLDNNNNKIAKKTKI